MGKTKSKKVILYFVGLSIVLVIAAFFIVLGPPKLLAKTDTPGFCVSCHVMESSYEAWIHAGAHRRNYCVDCHLPHENMPAHYAWKAIDGFKDMVVFYSGSVPDRITISSHGKKVLQANCIRCHEATVTMIDKERKCWECHKRITHKLSGAIETLL